MYEHHKNAALSELVISLLLGYKQKQNIFSQPHWNVRNGITVRFICSCICNCKPTSIHVFLLLTCIVKVWNSFLIFFDEIADFLWHSSRWGMGVMLFWSAFNIYCFFRKIQKYCYNFFSLKICSFQISFKHWTVDFKTVTWIFLIIPKLRIITVSHKSISIYTASNLTHTVCGLKRFRR